MARTNDPEFTVKVADVAPRKGVRVGKPDRIITSTMRMVRANLSGIGGGSVGGGGTTQSSGGSYYSPELSTDFLELPQSLDELRNYFRFFYENDPFVGQAIDQHTELPLSKVRLRRPEAKSEELASKALRFCERWARKNRLMHLLLEIAHEYWLLGEVFIFPEDTSPDMPQDITHEPYREVTPDGEVLEEWVEYEDHAERALKWLKSNYEGWSAIRILPPEQIHMESFPFTDERLIELVPDSKTKAIVQKAREGDARALRIVESMPTDVVLALGSGENIPLNTDPDAGSFCHYLARKKSQYEPRGKSILQRCLLPGTPIWLKRGGVIQQIPVEDVVTGDLLLTHKGRFQPCTAGSRAVNEDVVVLSVEGIDKPLALTIDHEVLRTLSDGSTEWVEAGALEPGDLLSEAHVTPEKGYLEVIDLQAWWQGRILVSDRRSRENQAGFDLDQRKALAIESFVDEDGELSVVFEYPQDDAGRIEAVKKTASLMGWLQNLKSPATASYKEVGAVTGLSKSEMANAVVRLRENVPSFQVRRGEDRRTVWEPLAENTPVPGALLYQEKCSPVTRIQVTETFCYLLGTWLGDGDLWTSRERFLNVDSIGWTFGKDPIAQAVKVRVEDAIQECFGGVPISGPLYQGGYQETDSVRIQDPLLGRWFKEEFGHGAAHKRLPGWVFGLPEKHVFALLRGLLDTDGCLSLKRLSSIDIQLDNRPLLEQVHLLCNRLGLHSNVKPFHRKARSWNRRWKTKSGWKEKTYQYEAKTFWRLVCSRFADVQRWAGEGSVKGDSAKWPKNRGGWKSKFVGGRLTRKITTTRRVRHKGFVYSFDVPGDKSHTAGPLNVHNCLRVLVFRDKLRQAQTSIASRHMTPFRIVYGEDLSADQTEELREQVDLALMDPDYSIITNFPVTWEEMGADNRLLDLSGEYDLTDRQLYAGLGVTESLLSGESAYSGDRINLEVINTRYMLFREILQEFVERYLFEPMCRRMGFIETDEDGYEYVVVPKLSFTRLAIRDSADVFDHLFNLYQKGSVDIDIILDLLNIDPIATKEKLERDLFTLNDSSFNEVMRAVYSRAGDDIVENSNVAEKIATETLGLDYAKAEEEGSSRFASKQFQNPEFVRKMIAELQKKLESMTPEA